MGYFIWCLFFYYCCTGGTGSTGAAGAASATGATSGTGAAGASTGATSTTGATYGATGSTGVTLGIGCVFWSGSAPPYIWWFPSSWPTLISATAGLAPP